MADAPLDARPAARPFIERLERIRVRARRLLLTHGVLVFVAAIVGGTLAVCALDYLLWFPGAFRLGFLVALVVVAARLIGRRLLPALTARFVLLDVATKIEQRFPEFEDRLTSSVSFLTHEQSAHDELQQQLVARTEDIAARLPLEDAITTGPLRRVLITAVVPVLLAAAAGVARPDLCAIGLQRLGMPLGDVDWPRRVTITPISTEMTVAHAEPVVLSMEITAGAERTDRAVLYVRRSGGTAERLPMRQEGPARYAATLPAVTEDLTFWFEAGDDSTRRRLGRVRVVARPVIQNLRLEVEPPPYVQPAARRGLPLGQTAIDMIAGSTLHLAFRSSKPLADEPAGATVMADDGTHTPATVDPDDPQKWSVAVAPAQDRAYTLRLVDDAGFENTPQPAVTVRLTPDAAPTVELLSPTQVLQCTPTATVQLSARVRDDLGLDRIGLATTVNDGDTEGFSPIVGWTVESQGDRGVITELQHAWPLAPLRTQPGDIVRYAVVAEDNRATADRQAQQGRSHLMALEITSPQQLAARIAEDLHHLAAQLRGLGQRQELLVTRTSELAEDLTAASARDVEDVLLDTGTRQRGLARQLGGIRRKAVELVDRLAANNIAGTQANVQTVRFVEQLRDDIEPPAATAAGRLHAARGHTGDGDLLQADVAEALQLERAAAAAIAALLDELAVWDDYNSVMVHLRELIDAQQTVSRDTAVLQDRTLGRSIDDLDDDVRADLERAAQAQEDISSTLDRAVAELRRLRRELLDARPDEARSLHDAERQLESRQAATLSRNAAEAIRRNQTGQAQQDQNTLERLLADTVGELERTEERQLAALNKELHRLEDLLAALHVQQTTLFEDTGSAAAGTALPALAARQRTIHAGAQQAARAVAALPDGAAGAQRVQVSAGHMEQSTTALYDEDGARASAAQQAALEWLERARAWLDEQQDQTAQRLELANLNATRQALKAARGRQLEVNAASVELIDRVADHGRAARRDTRRARQQAGEQQAIRDELAPLLDRLAAAPVYSWVMERILEAMADSQRRLRSADLDAELAGVQRRAVTLIDRLVEAIDQVNQMARDQFAAGAGGGSGSGSGGGPQAGEGPPVPTIAELLVLKAMQQDIRDRTADMHDDLGDRPASEAELRAIERLGRDQAELRELTIALTAKARG